MAEGAEKSDAKSTKERLLDSAEKLFAERGYDSVSIRDLAADADVNVAAVNYHFQGKEKLYEAVILRRVDAKREASLAAIRSAESQTDGGPDGRPDATVLIHAFVAQYLEEMMIDEHGKNFLRLVALEMHSAKRPSAVFITELIVPINKALSDALCAAEPRLSRDQASWVIMALIGQSIHLIMRWQKRYRGPDGHPAGDRMDEVFPILNAPLEQYVRDAVDFVTTFSVGGLKAITSSATATDPPHQ